MMLTDLIERINEDLVLLEAYNNLPENYYGRLRNRKNVQLAEIKDFIYHILAENVGGEKEILMDIAKIIFFLELKGEKN